jgi:hypothetical protein
MTKLIEHFDQVEIRRDWRTLYFRYRAGRLKHQYWLHNRKTANNAVIDSYDYSILKNCQPGTTVFFGSAGYYIRDIFPDVEVIEMHPVVKTFYPDAHICTDRAQLSNVVDFRADNFAVVNNRGDHWVDVNGLTDHMHNYTAIMQPGCRVFYSLRDTQIHVNRLTTDLEQHFLNWAQSLSELGLTLVWHSMAFPKKQPKPDGSYDLQENPDTTNGNLKFWFVYKGEPWTVI